MSFTLLGILNSQAAGGGAASAIEFISSSTLQNDGQFAFTNISALSDYQELIFRVMADTKTDDSLGIRVNNDSTLFNYRYTAIQNSGSSIGAGGESRAAFCINPLAPQSSDVNTFNAYEICVSNLHNTNKYTQIRAQGGRDQGGVSGVEMGYTLGWHIGTAAVTRLDFFASDSGSGQDRTNLKAGSRIDLYGRL